jgi:hypothetical protein
MFRTLWSVNVKQIGLETFKTDEIEKLIRALVGERGRLVRAGLVRILFDVTTKDWTFEFVDERPIERKD